MKTAFCECADRRCPCGGNCCLAGVTTLYRIDMGDHTGTLFCDSCAEDATASGLFSPDPDGEDDDECQDDDV